MISRANKFPLRTQFYSWRKRAVLTRTPHLLIYSHPSTTPQVAVVIPKKAFKLATTRNALKRTLLDNLYPLAASSRQNLVVFVKTSCAQAIYLQEIKGNS